MMDRFGDFKNKLRCEEPYFLLNTTINIAMSNSAQNNSQVRKGTTQRWDFIIENCDRSSNFHKSHSFYLDFSKTLYDIL